ncbi:MAG: hypothetical protein ACR2RL_17585 [Gammaproteobacteria bacterium]
MSALDSTPCEHIASHHSNKLDTRLMTLLWTLLMFALLQGVAIGLFVGSVWLGNLARRRRRGLTAKNIRIQSQHTAVLQTSA